MRLFFYPVILTIALLVVFAEIATPFIQRHPRMTHTLPVHKILYLERGMPDEEALHILAAAMEWHEVTNGEVTFDIKRLPQKDIMPSDAIIIFNVTPDFPEVLLLDGVNDYSTLGFFNDDAGVDYISLVDERISEDYYTPVIMHELGHALGLEHPNSKKHPEIGIGSLMYSTINEGSNHITDLDLEQFCKLYHCDASKYHGIP